MTTLLAWLADVRWHGLLELIPDIWALLRVYMSSNVIAGEESLQRTRLISKPYR